MEPVSTTRAIRTDRSRDRSLRIFISFTSKFFALAGPVFFSLKRNFFPALRDSQLTQAPARYRRAFTYRNNNYVILRNGMVLCVISGPLYHKNALRAIRKRTRKRARF